MTITVTPQQAQRLAAEMQQFQATLQLLTLGTVAQGHPLLAIDTDTGVLAFANPERPEAA